MPMSCTFGPFRADAEAGVPFRGAAPTLLGRRGATLLRSLLERPRRLISKEVLVYTARPDLAVETSNLGAPGQPIERSTDCGSGAVAIRCSRSVNAASGVERAGVIARLKRNVTCRLNRATEKK